MSTVNFIAVLEKTGNTPLSGWKKRIFVVLDNVVEYYEAPEDERDNIDAFTEKLKQDLQNERTGYKRLFLIKGLEHKGDFRIREIANMTADETEPNSDSKAKSSARESLLKKTKQNYVRIHVEVGDRTHHFRTTDQEVAVQFIRHVEARRRFISTGEVIRTSLMYVNMFICLK